MSKELLLAAEQGDQAELEALLEERADIDIQNEEGTTALHEATLNRDIAMMTFLLQRGATVDLADVSGKSALNHVYAEYVGDDEDDLLPAIELLMLYGADSAHADGSNDTLMQWARPEEGGHPNIVALLQSALEYTDDSSSSETEERSFGFN